MHIWTKFHQNLCSGFRKEVENVFNEDPLGILETQYEWFLACGFIEDFLRIGQKNAQNYP